MIIARILPCAGAGNQMFMYAAGLSLASKFGTVLRVSSQDFTANTRAGRPYVLDCFSNITEQQASFAEMFRICPKRAVSIFLARKKAVKRYHIFRRAARKLSSMLLSDKGLYSASWYSWHPEFEDVRDNTYIEGYFESEKIFAGIPGLVREKFTFPPEYFDPFLSARIKSCNSVAVHVRRGDKVRKDNDRSSNVYYLKAAIERILSLTDNPSFFVFSDDIAWCRKNLPLIHEADYTFIEGQTPLQDMALMTLCKHVIAGVSTFSWWGAWLNENPSKIVIAPDINIWYTKLEMPTSMTWDRKHLLPDRWIKIG